MKTTIKILSSLVLSVGFLACGGEPLAENQTVDESGNVVESVEQAITGGRCRVTSSTSNVQTGYCYANGLQAYRPNYCTVGMAQGTPTYGGTLGGSPVYVNFKQCN